MVNHVDDLLAQIGTGKWNLFHFLTVSIGSGVLAPFTIAGAFVVPRLKHVCVQSLNKDDYNSINSYTENSNDSCTYLSKSPEGDLKEEPCTQWMYDNSTYTKTMTSEFNLVCEKEYIRALYMSLYMLGVLFASPSIGYISDRFGRKNTFTVGVLCLVLLTHLSGWLPNVPSLLVFRFLLGMSHVPVVKISYIIGMETASPQMRSIAGIMLYLPWSLFYIAFGGLAYLERDWRWLLTYSSFISLMILPSLWFMDETPHWLAVKGYHARTLQVLKKAARWNNATLPPDEEILYRLKSQHNAANTIKDHEESVSWKSALKENIMSLFILFRTPRLRVISSVMHLCFLCIGMIYYGLVFSGGAFDIDIFLYIVLCGLTEIPATTILSPIVARVGRKKPFIFGFLSTGIIVLCIPFVPASQAWLAVTLALVGRTTICVASSVIYLYASELFPTEVRTRGITYSFMMSRVGSAIAPFVTEYLAISYAWAPSVVFGGIAMVSGLAAMVLSETLGTSLPDTIAFLESNPQNSAVLREKEVLIIPNDQIKGILPEEDAGTPGKSPRNESILLEEKVTLKENP